MRPHCIMEKKSSKNVEGGLYKLVKKKQKNIKRSIAGDWHECQKTKG